MSVIGLRHVSVVVMVGLVSDEGMLWQHVSVKDRQHHQLWISSKIRSSQYHLTEAVVALTSPDRIWNVFSAKSTTFILATCTLSD